MPKELYNLFSAVLLYLESADYKSSNDLALELFDIDSSLISEAGFTVKRMNKIVIKLLLSSIETNPNVTNLSAFQYVCFSMDNGISKIINLDDSYYYNTNSVGVLNNLALAYYVSGDCHKALEIQKTAIRNIYTDVLQYDNQRDLIYFNEMIYEFSCNGAVNIDNKQRILNVLSSEYVYDFEYALLTAILFDDYEYFSNHYKEYSLIVDFDKQVKAIFNEYYKNQNFLNTKDFLKYLKPLEIYDELLYKNNI